MNGLEAIFASDKRSCSGGPMELNMQNYLTIFNLTTAFFTVLFFFCLFFTHFGLMNWQTKSEFPHVLENLENPHFLAMENQEHVLKNVNPGKVVMAETDFCCFVFVTAQFGSQSSLTGLTGNLSSIFQVFQDTWDPSKCIF